MMKLSTEVVVELAVAVVFLFLSLGAIAREQAQAPARNGHNAYVATTSINVPASSTDVLGVY